MAPLEKQIGIQQHHYISDPTSQVKSGSALSCDEKKLDDNERHDSGEQRNEKNDSFGPVSSNEEKLRDNDRYESITPTCMINDKSIDQSFEYASALPGISRKVSVQLPPQVLMIHGMVNQKITGGNCKKLVSGGVLQECVKSIIVSTEWFHNLGFDGASRLVLTLYNDEQKVQKRVDVFGQPPSRGFAAYRFFSQYEEIVAMAEPGFHYQLEIKVAKGMKDAITLAGLICKITPISTIGQSINYTDAEGSEGRYRGDIDSQGRPQGRGAIDYKNGCTFIGYFKEGEMKTGVKYFGPDVISSMKEGSWDDETDTSMTTEFDYDVHFFLKEIKAKNLPPEPVEVEHAPNMLTCAAFGCF